MKRLLVILAFCSCSAFAADAASGKIAGYISDSKCGATHTSSAPDAACVKACIGAGAKPVFVDDAQKQVWTIDDPDAVKGHYGHHVSVVGSRDETNKTIHIAKVTMLANQGTQAHSDMHQ
jgi:hypothetical protein